MFIATMDTESRSWMGTGITEKDAQSVLIKGFFKVLGMKYSAWRILHNVPSAGNMIDTMNEWYGIHAVEAEPGMAFMDSELIK